MVWANTSKVDFPRKWWLSDIREIVFVSCVVCPVDIRSCGPGGAELVCAAAGHGYSTAGDPAALSSESNYADGFGAQWHQYRSRSWIRTPGPRSPGSLRRCLGEELWQAAAAVAGLAILEIGLRGREVHGNPVEAAGGIRNVHGFERGGRAEPAQLSAVRAHRIIQCDINQLPFQPGQYDIVICLGVIQHTKNPERTIADLYRQVKPGGWLVIDHYAPSLPPTQSSRQCWCGRFSSAVAAVRRRRRPGDHARCSFRCIAQSGGQAVADGPVEVLAAADLLPCPSATQRQLQYEWAELDTHDSLTDYYKHLRSPRAIQPRLQSSAPAEFGSQGW